MNSVACGEVSNAAVIHRSRPRLDVHAKRLFVNFLKVCHGMQTSTVSFTLASTVHLEPYRNHFAELSALAGRHRSSRQSNRKIWGKEGSGKEGGVEEGGEDGRGRWTQVIRGLNPGGIDSSCGRCVGWALGSSIGLL